MCLFSGAFCFRRRRFANEFSALGLRAPCAAARVKCCFSSLLGATTDLGTTVGDASCGTEAPPSFLPCRTHGSALGG